MQIDCMLLYTSHYQNFVDKMRAVALGNNYIVSERLMTIFYKILII